MRGGVRVKIYLAGKICGDPEYRKKFREAARKLERSLGAAVLNPASLPEGMQAEDYMAICFAMLERADMAAFLPEWEQSRGAKLERAWCEYVGKPTMEVPYAKKQA